MKDFVVSAASLPNLMRAMEEELAGVRTLLVTTSDPSTGKWGMARLWRAWMGTTGAWMAANGATMPLCISANGQNYGSRPFNADDAHELFTARWLGVDADGNRLSWSKQGREGMRAATKGERFLAMQQHEDWATERGIILLNPRDSEYRQLEREQNA